MTIRFTKLATLMLLLNFWACGQDVKKLTEEDYQKATMMLSGNTSKLIDNYIHPEWLEDDRLWYRSLTESKAEYKLFNPSDKKMITANSTKELFEKAGITSNSKSGKGEGSVSPDGKYEIFIRDWNLWIREKGSGAERALTTNGVKDFGYATDNAGWTHSDQPIVSWSPDSKKIATFQQDQRGVGNMYLVETKVGTPELEEWKYPLPGDSTIIQIHRVIISINIDAKPKVVRLKKGPDPRRATLLDDIAWDGEMADVAWSDDGKQLAFVSTSRDHKQAKLQIANTETGEVKVVLEENSPTQYESGQDAICWRYLSKSNEIIWYSEKSDWGHLYLYDAITGKLKNQITAGAYVVREVLHIDQKKRLIYFIGGGREAGNPYYRYLYSVDFNGKNLKLLTPDKGDHSISFSPGGKYFTDSYSQPDVPPVYAVRDVKGKQVAILEKTDIARLKATGWKPPTPFDVKSANNEWNLYGLLFTPTTLEVNAKYPVVVYIYPGPQGGSVSGWGFYPARGDCQAIAELGFVVMQLEGSCNPGRSKLFHDACYGNMAENTLPDQIAGLKQLAEKYPFIDLEHVGIWGHSGGGFATAAALLRYPDFFKVGVSQSGNHDNRNYEDDWGERYIGLETYDANGVSNYEKQANQVYATNLKGKLLLIHGGMDDNVPPYNAYLLADALIKANKDFDFIVLPHAHHGYGKDNYYITRRRWDYFVRHLLQAIPPKEYLIRVEPDPRIETPR